MSDAPTPRYDALAEAKRLLRTIRAASLATLDPSGAPVASLAAVATMPDGRPILLLSRLAAHTLHLEGDGRCSILLAQPGKGDPLAHPRLTLVGEATPAGDERDAARSRFLARNPKSELYADFPDFSFWLMMPRAASLNGGFGKAASFDGPALLTPIDDCKSLIESEESAISHMNADHRDALALYATKLLNAPDGAWRVSGIDPEGLDLVSGDLCVRLVFPQRITSGQELRKALAALAAEARVLDQ